MVDVQNQVHRILCSDIVIDENVENDIIRMFINNHNGLLERFFEYGNMNAPLILKIDNYFLKHEDLMLKLNKQLHKKVFNTTSGGHSRRILLHSLDCLCHGYVHYLFNHLEKIILKNVLFFANSLSFQFNDNLTNSKTRAENHFKDAISKNYMMLCNRYGFFKNNKMNPDILLLNKILNVCITKLYKGTLHYNNSLNDIYHVSLYKFNKYITKKHVHISHFLKLITMERNYDTYPLYFINNLCTYNITLKKRLLEHIFKNFNYNKHCQETGTIKQMKNIIQYNVCDYTNLTYFIEKHLNMPLSLFKFKELNQNLLILCCNCNNYYYDFDIKSVEGLIREDLICHFVYDINYLKKLHKKNIDVSLCERILNIHNSEKIAPLINYLIKKMNFKPTIDFFVSYFLKNYYYGNIFNPIRQEITHYIFNVEEDYEKQILLNNKALTVIEPGKERNEKLKLKILQFLKIKQTDDLKQHFLKYLIDNHLTISEYFVIDDKLEELLKIKKGTTLHINNIGAILTHI